MKNVVIGTDLLDQERIDGQNAHASSEDKAKPDECALSVRQLERWLEEIRNQPQWRREADKCVDYYDGNQLDADTLERLEAKGLGPLITNLIAPTVNAVLGMEAKTRTDWHVGADDDKYGDVAEALNSKLHEAERESNADRSNSDAYAAMIKAGFGAVEVSRESNPFKFPYRVDYIHRSELFWDWHCKKPDWSDARYVVRKKQFDADHIASFFPDFKDVIKAAGNWRDWTDYLTFDSKMSAELLHSIDQGIRTSWDDLDWRDVTRQRVVCYEVWYRVWVRGLVLKLPGGRTLEFDPKNKFHRAVVASGVVQPQAAVYDKIRCAFYIGPIRVRDMATNKRCFPYIPFYGYREDLTGVPYGLIRSMLSPQDEINARTARMMWLLNSRRVMIDEDALSDKNTHSDVSREIARADAYIITNPTRSNGANAIRIDDNMALSQQQFSVMQERKAAIQEAAGVYSAMMGQQSNASSGLAIQSLVEQGVTTLAEINDNYRMSRRMVGEALLDLIKEDTIEQAEVLVDTGIVKRRVIVNIPRVDPETGQKYKENDVQTAPVKVALSDVPSTPTYRQQQFG
ncbi:MAG: phage portal protein, partial [Pusillimonas sp.]|nr:phage portal protein [Pusillimonas sp.]